MKKNEETKPSDSVLCSITSMSVKPFEKFSLYDEGITTVQTDRTTPIKRMAVCPNCNGEGYLYGFDGSDMGDCMLCDDGQTER